MPAKEWIELNDIEGRPFRTAWEAIWDISVEEYISHIKPPLTYISITLATGNTHTVLDTTHNREVLGLPK